MNVAHILLGCPWIYDKNATNFCKENTYTFSHNEKTIRLAPARLHDYNKDKGTISNFSHSNIQPKQLHSLMQI